MSKVKNSEKTKSAIVIKRIRKPGDGGHAAAWKIAYADFMTALMAFFLLLWLLGSTTRGDQKGIEDYFRTPLQTAFWDSPGAGNSRSVVPGGGDSMTASVGEIKRAEKVPAKAKRQEILRQERHRMEELRMRLDGAIQHSSRLAQFRSQIRVEITPDGLRIQVVDDLKRPMFDLGSARLRDYMRDVLREFGAILNDFDGGIVLAGHTDSARYAAGDGSYSNWELSIDRANSARRELIAGGLDAGKTMRVVGLADSSPLDGDDPTDPINRRISIIVLNKLAEERMNSAGGEIEAGKAAGIWPLRDPGEDSGGPQTGAPAGGVAADGAG